MTLSSITLNNFRSYNNAKFEFSEGINIISGQNGVGKTNLLEAIYYLATSKSARSAKDRELINFSSGIAEIHGEFTSGGRAQTLFAKIEQGQRREFSLNGAPLVPIRDLLGILPAVFFDPSDLGLLQGGAGERRAFLDAILCQQSPRYLETLRRFRKYHRAKTKILSLAPKYPSYLDALEEYNHGLAATSATLAAFRSSFTGKLSQHAARHHLAISSKREALSFTYQTDSEDAAKSAFKMQAKRDAEIARKQCLVGAHRDDLLANLNEKSVKTFASQGQTRTAVISLKLAARDLLTETFSEPPLLLLDDVLSELDKYRQEYVLGQITGGQGFISCCEESKIPLNGNNITLR